MRFFLPFFLAAVSCFSWQDDVDLQFRKSTRFLHEPGIKYLPSAQGELRLGRYISGDKNHGWLGGAEGDVLLLSITKDLLWHWGLNMETLADDHNDIHFRLVQVYYQTRTGLSWRLGPGVLTLAYQHRCSHGADQAVTSRILIRSGLNTSYHWPLSYKALRLDLRASANAYVVGQNADVHNQARGGVQLNAQVLWPIKGSWSMLMGAGVGGELLGSGHQSLYNLASCAKSYRVESLFGTKLALRFEPGPIQNDYGLHFSQILDSGLTDRQAKHSSLTFDINFYW